MKAGLRSWRLAFSYARRELRAGLRGFYVFLACLALGVGAIAGVGSLSAGLIDSLRYDGRYILGGDMALRTVYQPATPEQISFLRRLGVVSVVMETRAMARAPDDSKAALVELKAIDPFYPLYGKIGFADAEGRPLAAVPQDMVLPRKGFDAEGRALGPWGAAVEKEVLTRLGLRLGDSVKIGGKDFELRGLITQEPDRVSSMRFSLAPRVMISLAVFPETGLQAAGNQVYYDHRLHLPYVRTPEGMQKVQDAVTAAFPGASWRGRTWYNASPNMERMVRRLTLFLAFIGLTALLVGGVGVSNAVRSFLDGKLSNIATLKCLGAPAAFIGRVYMAVIFLLTALGVLAGLILGAGAARLGGALLTARLALTDQAAWLYPGALATAAAFGLLTGICFSLWPVARAAAVSPRDLFRDAVQAAAARPGLSTVLQVAITAQALALLAITTASDRLFAAWFLGGAAGCFLLFHAYAFAIKRGLRRLRLPAGPVARLALANLTRPGNVTSGVILSLGLGLTVLVAVADVRSNFLRLLDDGQAGGAPAFFFLDIQPDQREAFARLVKETPSARDLVLAPSFRGSIAKVNGVPAEKALVDEQSSWVIRSDRGFTVAREKPPFSEVVEGAWWPADYSGPPAVSIATDVAKAFNIGVGAELTLSIFGAEVTAKVANVRDINWSSFAMNFAVTFAPGALFEKIPANSVATVSVDAAAEEGLQLAMARAFPNVTTVRVREAMETARSLVRGAAQAVAIGAGVTLVSGALVLAGGIAAQRRRHVYDAVVLKVLGASQGRILMTFLLEYGLLGLLTVFISAALGTLAARAVLGAALEVTWHFDPGALLAVALSCLALTLLAGFLGTWRALAQKPAPFLRNQ